jgi:NAD(P)-dependent dehydrogenase (short-subunit alcohol dehydrogenase family)
MRELSGRVAVVTGGGSGIGEALCRRLAVEKMRVVVADVEEREAARVAGEIHSAGGEALAAAVDVRDPDSVERLAERTCQAFGACQLLANNAGVALFRPALEMAREDWEWVLSVNLMGVVHGIAAFLPRMRDQGGEAHIVNTASISGLVALRGAGLSAYTASKFGVVALSEVLHEELAEAGIGVSVVCPGGVTTRILESERNRPPALQTGHEPPAAGERRGQRERVSGMLAPETVAEHILDAVRRNVLYVITHPDWKPLVDERHSAIAAAFAAAAARAGA